MKNLNEAAGILKSLAPKITRHEETPRSLYEKLDVQSSGVKQGITEERLRASIGHLRALTSFFRWYPDLYLDSIKDPRENFKFYAYQRLFLRCALRHRYMYATFPRAYSKSFLAIMAEYLKCIFYPNSKLFIVSGGKEQSTRIAQEKIEELWKFFPALKDELIFDRGAGQNSCSFKTDYIKLVFKNGSYLDVVAARQSSRGGRRTSGLIEESAQVDGQILSEVIIPMMNVSRRAAFGGEDKHDITNKAQLYITTAGDKGTFAYDKMTQIFLWSLMRPEESICIGGTWRVPVANGLLSKNFVNDLKDDGTYSPYTFQREYESEWGGGNSNSFFSAAEFDKNRVIEKPMWEAEKRPEKGSFVILSYDVGRLDDRSSLVIIKCVPSIVRGGGTYTKKVVNIFTFDKMHFEEQAVQVKKIFFAMRAKKIIIDANGIGAGLIDFLVIPTIDARTGEELPPLSIDKKSDPKDNYKKFYNIPGGIEDAVYLIKANGNSNSEMHNLCNAQIASGKVQFLIDDQYAENRLKRTLEWKTMSLEKRIEVLKPYKMTKVLRGEMMNLKKVNTEDNTTTLKKISGGIKKDIFSALEYGIYYARTVELANKNTNILSGGMNLCTITPKNLSRNGSIRDRFSSREGRWRR